MFTVVPGVAELIAFWIVLQGCASVPGFASSPPVETWRCRRPGSAGTAAAGAAFASAGATSEVRRPEPGERVRAQWAQLGLSSNPPIAAADSASAVLIG
jgi:hypothetical protein